MEQQSTHHTNGNNIPTNEDILAAICANADLAENNEVKQCIRAYKLDSTLKSLTVAFNKFLKPTLIKTLVFLKAPEKDWNNLLKPDVANEVICRIQNLLRDHCNIWLESITVCYHNLKNKIYRFSHFTMMEKNFAPLSWVSLEKTQFEL